MYPLKKLLRHDLQFALAGKVVDSTLYASCPHFIPTAVGLTGEVQSDELAAWGIYTSKQ